VKALQGGLVAMLALTGMWAAASVTVLADDPPAPHLVIIERKIEVLEDHLKAAAARGYRVVGAVDGSAGFTRTSPVRVHLEPQAEGEPRLEYRVVMGPYSKQLENVVNDEASKGFRVLPQGVLRKVTPNPLGDRGSREAETVVLVMERDGRGPPEEYKIISPGTPKEFRREISKHTQAGFSLTGVRGFNGGYLLTVLQRPIIEKEYEPPPEGADPQYIAIDERDRQKLFDAVGDAAARGYRIVETIQRGFAGRGNVVLLEKAAVPGRPYSYFFLGTPTPINLADSLNEGAVGRYRFQSGLDPRVELIMERAPLEQVDATYRTVSGESAATIEEEVAAAIADGYVFAGLYGDVVVLGKLGPGGGGADQESP
jgi:hypothetical protein